MKAEPAERTGAGRRPLERRQYPRKEAFWRARLQTTTGDFDCRVLSLSFRGAKIEIDHPVAHRQAVTLLMERFGAFTGFVAWRRGGTLGIHIHEHRTTRGEIARWR